MTIQINQTSMNFTIANRSKVLSEVIAELCKNGHVITIDLSRVDFGKLQVTIDVNISDIFCYKVGQRHLEDIGQMNSKSMTISLKGVILY